MSGVLAIWNDRVPDGEAEYEAWYQDEHVPERLALPGFREARRYEAVQADRRYFTWYALESADCIRSPAYRARLEAPTPRTRAAMRDFGGMVRAELTVVASAGRGLGAYAVCLRWECGQEGSTPLDHWLRQPGVVRAQAWRAASGADSLPATAEKACRDAPDATVAGTLLVECLRLEDADGVARALADASARLGTEVASVGVYHLLCCTRAEAGP